MACFRAEASPRNAGSGTCFPRVAMVTVSLLMTAAWLCVQYHSLCPLSIATKSGNSNSFFLLSSIAGVHNAWWST